MNNQKCESCCAGCGHHHGREQQRENQTRAMVRIAVTAVLLAAALWIGAENPVYRFLLFFAPYLLIGYDVLWSAASNLMRGKLFDENFLMAAATVGAFCIGEYPEALAVMLFYQTGEYFQGLAVQRSRRSIRRLIDITPEYANIEENGTLRVVSPREIRVGDLVAVKPGERIPVDGVVVSGRSALDTKSLTGESMPKSVGEGDSVLSGCINTTAVIKIRATRKQEDSTASKILELAESAAEKKSKTENFITRFAKGYTPAVVVSALLLFLVPPLFFGGEYRLWLHRALVFLVISCPCALVISLPLSYFAGIGGAARRGILMKGGNYLQALSGADTVVFDKTGTLTEGNFSLTELFPASVTGEELLDYAACCEYYSDHPIARSIKTAYGKPVDTARIREARELAGYGTRAVVDGKQVLCGNARLMKSEGVGLPPVEAAGTLVYLAVDGRYAGALAIADRVKPGAAGAIASLKKRGIVKTVMLTGDGKKEGERVAAALGIDEMYAELLPAGKVSALETVIASSAGKVIFVGDGMNDAPVLSRSDIGVAMGALGSDAAIEAADVVLSDDKLEKLETALAIAGKTKAVVWQNIVFALSVKALVLALGAAGYAGMGWAVFADVGVSFLAILNAMRILRG